MITLGLVARDESKYLKEWVLYHHLIGVNNFVIYLHNCVDDSILQLKKLNIPMEIRIKNTASLGWEVKNEMYQQIFDHAITEYVCCLDIDEFIFMPNLENINEFLDQKKFTNTGGIVLFQNVFGPNGHVKSPEGLVIDNYTKRNPDSISYPNHFPIHKHPYDMFKNIKTIIKKQHLKKILNSHDYICDKPIVDENGDIFAKYKNNRQLSNIRINHYYTKSVEDWEFKTSRTRFSKSFKYPNSWFKYYADFDFIDTKIKDKYSEKIHEMLGR